MQSVGLGRHDRGRCGHTGGVGWRKAGADCVELCTVYCTVRVCANLAVVDVEREDLIKLDVGCIHSTMTVSTRCIKYRYISLNISTSGKETAHTKLPSTERSSAKNWMKELGVLYSLLYGLAAVELRGTEYEELGTSPLLACAPGECTQEAVSIAHCPARYECQPRDKDRAKQGCGQKVRVGQTTESDACWIRLRQFDQGPATDRWIVGSLPPLRRE